MLSENDKRFLLAIAYAVKDIIDRNHIADELRGSVESQLPHEQTRTLNDAQEWERLSTASLEHLNDALAWIIDGRVRAAVEPLQARISQLETALTKK